VVGISALLTTTMVNMEKTGLKIKKTYTDVKVIVGGAPLNQSFADQIGADGYASDPQGAVTWLSEEAAG
jgi:methanogenic corrinoid protein MtbC1